VGKRKEGDIKATVVGMRVARGTEGKKPEWIKFTLVRVCRLQEKKGAKKPSSKRKRCQKEKQTGDAEKGGMWLGNYSLKPAWGRHNSRKGKFWL